MDEPLPFMVVYSSKPPGPLLPSLTVFYHTLGSTVDCESYLIKSLIRIVQQSFFPS